MKVDQIIRVVDKILDYNSGFNMIYLNQWWSNKVSRNRWECFSSRYR